jgi:hypothetical protein
VSGVHRDDLVGDDIVAPFRAVRDHSPDEGDGAVGNESLPGEGGDGVFQGRQGA